MFQTRNKQLVFESIHQRKLFEQNQQCNHNSFEPWAKFSLLNVCTVIVPTANSLRKIHIYKSQRVREDVVQTFSALSRPVCACVCVSKYIQVFIPVCECVSVCLHACQQVWETDGGLEPTLLMQKLRMEPQSCISGESAAAADDWGPGCSADVMEPVCSWTSLSPSVCDFDCPFVALTAQPPVHLAMPACPLTPPVVASLNQ